MALLPVDLLHQLANVATSAIEMGTLARVNCCKVGQIQNVAIENDPAVLRRIVFGHLRNSVLFHGFGISYCVLRGVLLCASVTNSTQSCHERHSFSHRVAGFGIMTGVSGRLG